MLVEGCANSLQITEMVRPLFFPVYEIALFSLQGLHNVIFPQHIHMLHYRMSFISFCKQFTTAGTGTPERISMNNNKKKNVSIPFISLVRTPEVIQYLLQA